MTVTSLPIVPSEHRTREGYARAPPQAKACAGAWPDRAQRSGVAELLALVADRLPIRRRMMHAADTVYAAGERLTDLYVVNSGFFKTVDTTADGRDHIVCLNFRGDWLGFDGIATGHYGCDTVALDTGEVWALNYDALIRAGMAHSPLLAALHIEMSRAMRRQRESMLSLCTLTVAARVAEFLRYWAESLAGQGQCADRVRLPISRADIGKYLGMTLESVSRGFSELARSQLIRFTVNGRRDIFIPDLRALAAFAQGQPGPQRTALRSTPDSAEPQRLEPIAARGLPPHTAPSLRSMPADRAIRPGSVEG